MPVDPQRALFTDTEPATHGFRHELLRIPRLKTAGLVVLLVAVALAVYGRTLYQQHQHRREIRNEFVAEHAKDCAESWDGVETTLHPYEEAHRHLLDQLAVEDTEAVINRDVPNFLTKAAALHDALIHARATCPAQADPSRQTNTDRVGAVDGVDVRDLY
ncbi:MAG TPA: hypothetical protein VEI01_15980 [Terriglobales bacterium]|nr:hypothetical protein [Terriglobales bacterium]